MGFGPLGFPEMMLIMVLALLVFGPRKLPELGRTIGKGMAEFRRATSDLKRSIDDEVHAENSRASLASSKGSAPAPAGEATADSKADS